MKSNRTLNPAVNAHARPPLRTRRYDPDLSLRNDPPFDLTPTSNHTLFPDLSDRPTVTNLTAILHDMHDPGTLVGETHPTAAHNDLTMTTTTTTTTLSTGTTLGLLPMLPDAAVQKAIEIVGKAIEYDTKGEYAVRPHVVLSSASYGHAC